MTATAYPPNLKEILDGMPFPATKTEIVGFAEDKGVSEEAVEILRILPGREYENREELTKDLGLSGDLPNNGNLWPSQREEELFDKKNSDISRIKGQGKISG